PFSSGLATRSLGPRQMCRHLTSMISPACRSVKRNPPGAVVTRYCPPQRKRRMIFFAHQRCPPPRGDLAFRRSGPRLDTRDAAGAGVERSGSRPLPGSPAGGRRAVSRGPASSFRSRGTGGPALGGLDRRGDLSTGLLRRHVVVPLDTQQLVLPP